MPNPYAAVLRRPGAAQFVSAGFVGRLPMSMIPLGVVLLVTDLGGNYAAAGALAAVYALSHAAIAPLGARLIDRVGQARVVPVLLAVQLAGLLGFVAVADDAHPLAVMAIPLGVAGAAAPDIGALVRARWAAMLSGEPGLRSAFAIEGLVDEVVFIIGPPLVTATAVSVGPVAGLLLCVVLLAVGGIWLASQRRTQPSPHAPGRAGPRTPYVGPAFAVVTVSLTAMGAMFGAFEVTTVAFCSEVGQEGLTGVVLALYAVGSLIAGVVYGARHVSWPPHRQFVIGSAVLVVVCAPLPFVGSVGFLMVAVFLAGLAVSPLLILNVGMVERLVPAVRLTEALTLGTSGIAVGLAIGSPLAGVLIDTYGAAAGYWIVVAGALMTLLLATVGSATLRRSLVPDDHLST